jgi:hypothetical protein
MDVVAIELLRAMVQARPDVQFVVYLDREDSKNELGTAHNLRKRVVPGPGWVAREQVGIPVACLRDRVDLVHYTSNTAAIFCPVPVVAHVHDVFYLEPAESRSESRIQQLGRLYRRWVVPPSARAAHAVITVSHHEARRVRSMLELDRHTVHAVYNGVSPIFFASPTPATTQAVQRRFDLPSRYLLFHGNTASKKNTTRTLHAWVAARRQPSGVPDLVVTELGSARVHRML